MLKCLRACRKVRQAQRAWNLTLTLPLHDASIFNFDFSAALDGKLHRSPMHVGPPLVSLPHKDAVAAGKKNMEVEHAIS